MTVELFCGDCLDILPTLEAGSVDSIITDPPYGLTEPRSGGNGHGQMWQPRDADARQARRGGFMGKKWDAGVPGIEYWQECLRVAKPGAALLAFGGTRTHHRLMCAIEDAGWEIRDCLMWIYGSGFPKSHDISKAIDKAAGAEREVVGKYARGGEYSGWSTHRVETGFRPNPSSGDGNITSPATEAAQLWDGWGTALKPAYEPIILAMKPRDGTFANNALEYGVAGIWVDGVRVGTGNDRANGGPSGNHQNASGEWGLQYGTPRPSGGRWPANLLLSHAPGCECVGVRKVPSNERKRKGIAGSPKFNGKYNNGELYANAEDQTNASPDGTETIPDWRCVPECPVRLLDEQSGERPSCGHYTRSRGNGENSYPDAMFGDYPGYRDRLAKYAGDTGGASRFFYTAKASRSERETGLLGHIPCLKCGELDSETHINPKTGKEEKCRRNGHPTVKPLDVCRWLCRLTKTPAGGVVLDPFMGSGRIPMAAILEGREAIGIELERPSFEIAYWAVESIQAEMVQARMLV